MTKIQKCDMTVDGILLEVAQQVLWQSLDGFQGLRQLPHHHVASGASDFVEIDWMAMTVNLQPQVPSELRPAKQAILYELFYLNVPRFPH